MSNRLVSCYPEARSILRRTNLSPSNCLESYELTYVGVFALIVTVLLSGRFIFDIDNKDAIYMHTIKE